MSIELARCPACGAESNTDCRTIEGIRGWGVMCCACWCFTGYEYDTEEKAVAAWNTRVEDPELERLKQAAVEFSESESNIWTSEMVELLNHARDYAKSRKEKQ